MGRVVVTHTYVVASQPAMLACSSATVGDLAIRTDLNETFILAGSDAAELSDWTLLVFPHGVAS